MSENALSIHLTDDRIRIVDANLSGSQINLPEIATISDLPPFLSILTDKSLGDVAKVIERLLGAIKSKKRNVNIVIPDSISYAQIIEMPKLKEKELLSAIKYQADQFIPMPIEKTTLDLEILQESAAQNTLLVLIVAAAEDMVKKIEKLVELSGLIPDSIENELSATGRILSQFYKPTVKPGGTLFVNFGSNSSSVYFFDHTLGLIIDSHTFTIGLNLFQKEIMANMNIDLQKAKELVKHYGTGEAASANLEEILEPAAVDLSREIENFMRASVEKHSGIPVQSIQFFNEIDDIPSLVKKLASHATIPLSRFSLDPFIVKTTLTNSYATQFSSFTCAIGGALR